jgi:hypothetical protein
MLLSFRLFVVIVAVDARWLSRSLETKYRELFGPPESDGRPDNAGTRSAAIGDGLRRRVETSASCGGLG